MNTHRLPKGHASILSPAFKYVPAACTDLAKTFARLRAQHIEPQPAPAGSVGSDRYRPELDIEVLEAAWLPRRPTRTVA